MLHVPVLLAETVARLVTAPGGWYVDATAGAGGHAAAVLAAAGLDARLLALDRDGDALELARAALAPLGDRAILERANFADLADVAARHGVPLYLPPKALCADNAAMIAAAAGLRELAGVGNPPALEADPSLPLVEV